MEPVSRPSAMPYLRLSLTAMPQPQYLQLSNACSPGFSNCTLEQKPDETSGHGGRPLHPLGVARPAQTVVYPLLRYASLAPAFGIINRSQRRINFPVLLV